MFSASQWLLLIVPAFIAALLAVFAIRGAAITDMPNARASHNAAVKTAGGVSVITALSVCLLIGSLFHLITAPLYLWCGALMMSVLGLYDDVRDVSAKVKLAVMIGLAIFSAANIGAVNTLPLPYGGEVLLPIWVSFSGFVIWIVIVVNAVNFVDGANGMLAGTAGVAAIGLLALGLLHGVDVAALWALSLLLGLAAFAPFNARSSANMFAGDVGALTAGFIIAVSGLMIASRAPQTLYALPLLILPILIDVFSTLLRRARCGEPLMQAHNQHLFQRKIQAGASHLRVSISYTIASAICALWGVILSTGSPQTSVLGLLGAAILGIGLYQREYAKAMTAIAAKNSASS